MFGGGSEEDGVGEGGCVRRKEEAGTRMPPDASRRNGVTDTGQKQGVASTGLGVRS
jgi:hypothetical protein